MGARKKTWTSLPQSLGFRITVSVGLILLGSYLVFLYLVVEFQKDFFFAQMLREAETFSTAVLNATNHSMLKDDREATANIVRDLSMQEDLSQIRIYDHAGVIRYANRSAELGQKVDKEAAACFACHSVDKPFNEVIADERTRIYESAQGYRVLGMITPIYNKPECSSAECHVHPPTQKVLGIIDAGMPLQRFDAHVRSTTYEILALGGVTLVVVMATMVTYITVRVNRPVKRLMSWIQNLALDSSSERIPVTSRDELGQLAKAFGLMSARIRRRTSELERSRQEFRNLFEQVPCFISVIDHDFKIVRQNTRMREYFRGTTGMHCYEVYKKRDKKCDVCVAELTLLDGKSYERQECGITISGEEANYVTHTVPVHNDKGDVLYAMVIAIDIGERIRLERELQVSVDFQTNLIENSIHGIIAIDEKGRVNLFNKAAEYLLGYQADEVLGDDDLQKYFPKQFVEMIIAAVRGERIADHRLVAQEAAIFARDGERIPVRFSGAILYDDSRIAGGVGFYQDLRTFKELQREKAESDRLAVVGQTVAGLAHGIKNVIQGLEGGVFVVETAIEDNDKELLDRGWGMVTRNIDRVSALVKDLLSYSKERVPRYEWTDPNELAEDVCALFDLRAKERSIRIVRDFYPSLTPILLDQRGIHTALTNLVSNAIDACEMDIDEPDHTIMVQTRHGAEDGMIFEVSDNGIGMDEDVQSKVFSSFFSTKGAKGTGLGLLVTSKIVQEHGGEISFDSEPGQGSNFAIYLPYRDVVQEQPTDSSTRPFSFRTGQDVLKCEDNASGNGEGT